MQQKIEELKPYVAMLDSLRKREKQLSLLIYPIRDLNKNRLLFANVLSELSSRKPATIQFTFIDITSRNIEIKGNAPTNLVVAEFMNRLEESPYIANVDLINLSQKRINNQPAMEFTLTANPYTDTALGR